MNLTFLLQNVVNALQWGSFYALIALGYSMVYSILMLFNFAHGDIFMVGAYIGFVLTTALVALNAAGIVALPNWMILILTIVLAMLFTSCLGMLVERIGYRPLRGAPRASAAITGLMIGIILQTTVLSVMGAQRVLFPSLIQTTLQCGRRGRDQHQDHDRLRVHRADARLAPVRAAHQIRDGHAGHGL